MILITCPAPTAACERCVYGAGDHAEWCERQEEGKHRSVQLVDLARKELEAEVKRAQSLVDSQADLEDLGCVYKQETLDRAVKFLGAHVDWLWRFRGIKAAVPAIGLGPNGSIDLYWKRLLVNIPAGDENATFYGDDYGLQKTKGKGSFDPGSISNVIIVDLIRMSTKQQIPGPPLGSLASRPGTEGKTETSISEKRAKD